MTLKTKMGTVLCSTWNMTKWWTRLYSKSDLLQHTAKSVHVLYNIASQKSIAWHVAQLGAVLGMLLLSPTLLIRQNVSVVFALNMQ